MPTETSISICCLVYGGVLAKFPNLNFVMSHGGGSFPGIIGRINHGYEMRNDLFPNKHHLNDFVKRIYVDSHTCDNDMLHKIIDIFGIDKIVLGIPPKLTPRL